MHYQLAKEVLLVMHEYKTKGKKSAYKRKQMRRLMVILESLLRNAQQEDLKRIGRKHIIRYYMRHSHETHKTLKEKCSILEKFFSRYNPKVRVPKPNPEKCFKSEGYIVTRGFSCCGE